MTYTRKNGDTSETVAMQNESEYRRDQMTQRDVAAAIRAGVYSGDPWAGYPFDDVGRCAKVTVQ